MVLLLGITSGCINKTSTISTDITTTTKEEKPTTTELDNDYSVSIKQKEKRYYFYGEKIDPNDYEINIMNKKTKEIETIPLTSNLVSYELKNNVLNAHIYGKTESLELIFASNPYEWYQSTSDYMYYPEEESKTIILIMTNEESLKNKEYTDDDFSFINYVSFEEITIDRHKEIAIETSDPDFKRLFVFSIHSDDVSNIESYINAGKTKTWIYEIYRAPSASLEYVK